MASISLMTLMRRSVEGNRGYWKPNIGIRKEDLSRFFQIYIFLKVKNDVLEVNVLSKCFEDLAWKLYQDSGTIGRVELTKHLKILNGYIFILVGNVAAHAIGYCKSYDRIVALSYNSNLRVNGYDYVKTENSDLLVEWKQKEDNVHIIEIKNACGYHMGINKIGYTYGIDQDGYVYHFLPTIDEDWYVEDHLKESNIIHQPYSLQHLAAATIAKTSHQANISKGIKLTKEQYFQDEPKYGVWQWLDKLYRKWEWLYHLRDWGLPMKDVNFRVDGTTYDMRKGLGRGLWIYDYGKLVAVYYKPYIFAVRGNDFIIKRVGQEVFLNHPLGIDINVYTTRVIVVTDAVDKLKFSAPLLVNQNVPSYGLLDENNVYHKIQALVTNNQQPILMEANVEYRCATINEVKGLRLLCDMNKNISCVNVRYENFIIILENNHYKLENK